MSRIFLLDTDIVIYWLKNRYPSIDRKIKQNGSSALRLSSITVAELYFGAYNSVKKEENLRMAENLFEILKIVSFDETCGEHFGKIKALLKSRGQIISDSDIFIAATAVSNNFTLVTNNEKHFRRIENLETENWTS